MTKLPLSRRLREIRDRLEWIGEEGDRETLEEAALLAEREEKVAAAGGQLPIEPPSRAPTGAEVQAAIVLAFRSEVEPMRRRWGDDAAAQCDRLAGIAAQAAAQLLDGEPAPESSNLEDSTLPGFRAGDPDTSRKAALDVYPRAGSRRRAILDAAIRAGGRGITYPEADGLPGVRESWKRISELVEGGWLEATDRERRNPETGSDVTVYVATDAAIKRVGVPAGAYPPDE